MEKNIPNSHLLHYNGAETANYGQNHPFGGWNGYCVSLAYISCIFIVLFKRGIYMLKKNIVKLTTTFGLLIMLGAGYASYGQKDHGNGNGKGNGHGNGNGNGKHAENGGDQGRGNGNRERRQEDVRVYRQQGDNGRRYESGNKGWKGDNGGRRNEDRPVYRVPVYQSAPWGGGRVPPGQIRSQQVHERNAERKAIKDQEKAYRRSYKNESNDERRYYQPSVAPQWFDQAGRIFGNGYANPDQRRYQDRRRYRQNANVRPYAPGQGYYPQTNGYYADPNGYSYDQNQQYPYSNNGTSSKTNILRAIIGSILGGFGGQANGYDNGYQDNGYYDANVYNSGYANGPVRHTQPSYYVGAYSPRYTGYSPVYTQYAGYGQPQYDNYSSYDGGLLNSIPLAGLFGQRGGAGGYVTQILRQVLTQGYLEGLLAGRNARQNGSGNQYYNDPYVGADGNYDPYSYTIGENRRVLSEGYGLGFEDALSGRSQYDQRSAGKLNLVNLLLSNVFQIG